jgi:inner membrane protein
MPTIIAHAAVPLALWAAADRGRINPRLLAAGIAAAILPDLDVIGFALHVRYVDAIGHRGASHSLLFAAVLALLAALSSQRLRARPLQAATWILICAASHPLLDTLTNGGLGVALGWPWSEQRWFAPWRPIRVSPFANHFFSARGWLTLQSELRWLWLPLAAAVLGWKLIQPATTDSRTNP